MITLAQLVGTIAAQPLPAAAQSLPVADLTQDSREARPGSVFVALRGRSVHGLQFARQACAQGAVGVLWEAGDGVDAPQLPPGTVSLGIERLAERVGDIADRFFGSPSARLRICAVTGTNGKTTSAYLLAQCLQRLDGAAGYVGTLGAGRIGALQPLGHTTPDAITVHRILARLAADGVRDVAIEASSHALDQHRLAGVRLHAAAFTNLTHDHLDYHGTMQAYGEAKARLFSFPGLRHLIVNIGDGFGGELAARLRGDGRLVVVRVGAEPDGAWDGVRRVFAADVRCERRGLTLRCGGSFGDMPLQVRLIGRFNAENSLVVLATLLALGVPPAQATGLLAACDAPPGRMEIVPATLPGKPLAVVDYAHTPDALAKALAALRDHCDGELWCVFGCGGDRDAAKRPVMGRVADELADRIVVTDDNPRSEEPRTITAAIAAAISRHVPQVIGDRATAIATALGAARAGDVVLIAGKGHEDYQIYGSARRHFSDREEALRHLREAA